MNNISIKDDFRDFAGELEIITKDKHGRIVNRYREKNLIKIFAKEILSHRMPSSRIWDPTANSGQGGWKDASVDPVEDFAPKYILFGASFDDDGRPLGKDDDRYYVLDNATGQMVVRSPKVGADNMGDLVNPIPLSEPNRPLKRIENILFTPSYQPADSPLLQPDVRAVNNVVIFETTLRLDEYNGFGIGESDSFTITEVALAAGKELDAIGNCECTPGVLFLEGIGGSTNEQIPAIASGGSTISISSDAANEDAQRIKEGDQILIVAKSGTEEEYDTMEQVQPYYLAMQKAETGRDIILDRTPVDINGNPIQGEVGIYRSTLRIFSQRFLTVPFKKSEDFEILIRWYIRFA